MHDDPLHHYELERYGPEDEHPLAKLDTIRLTSVGIDVGTATTQIIFSRLVLRRMGIELSSRFVVVGREALFLSPVHLTPYTPSRERIDDQALQQLVDDAYEQAGLGHGDVDTGAVILTGEAMRRDNARAIADLFAEQRGNFVCASAGHNFEAMLAAQGSGTVAASEDRGIRLLNIDIGGGTTKLSAVEAGHVVGTAALHVGGRLVARDEGGVITILEAGGALLARNLGFNWRVGDRVPDRDFERLADYMARCVIAIVNDTDLPPELRELLLTPYDFPLSYDGVVFSGGVGEYVYGKENDAFGDLGAPLGRALKRYAAEGALPWPLLPARECIRATVMGASQYTVQVSGNTIYRSSADLLPRRNLQVLRPCCDFSGDIDADALAERIRLHFQTFDLQEGASDVVLVFPWEGPPTALRLAGFCQGLMKGLPNTIAGGRPIFLVFDHDLGALVGALLKEEMNLATDILSIDSIMLRDFDFIDIGQMLEPSGTVPVTIKSLIFQM